MFWLFSEVKLFANKNYLSRVLLLCTLFLINACGGQDTLKKSVDSKDTKAEVPKNFQTKVAAPVISPAGGVYPSLQIISLKSETPGASIYFTLDGSDPTPSARRYTSPLSINTTTTLKAIAATNSLDSSDITSEHYEISPPSPEPGSLGPVISNEGRQPFQLSQARGSITAVTVGSKTIFAGGSLGPTSSDVVDIYEASTNTWSIAKLSQARGGMSVTLLGTKAIFAGGFAAVAGSNRSAKSDVVDIYDASSNTWSTAKLSQARTSMGVISLGTKAIFAGGSTDVTSSNTSIMSDIVDIYDSSSNTWSTAKLSWARFNISAISVGSKALFAGGMLTYSDPQTERVVDIYDVSSNTWTSANLSDVFLNLQVVAAGSKAFFATNRALDLYDSTTDSWTSAIPPPLRDPYIFYDRNSNTWATQWPTSLLRKYNTATVVGSKAMFAGEVTSLGKIRFDIDVFDFSSNAWSKLNIPMYPYDGQTDFGVDLAMNLGSKAIFVRPPSESSGRLIHIYDVDTQNWNTIRCVGKHNNLIYEPIVIGNGSKLIFAGVSPQGNENDAVFIYDLVTNQWN